MFARRLRKRDEFWNRFWFHFWDLGLNPVISIPYIWSQKWNQKLSKIGTKSERQCGLTNSHKSATQAGRKINNQRASPSKPSPQLHHPTAGDLGFEAWISKISDPCFRAQDMACSSTSPRALLPCPGPQGCVRVSLLPRPGPHGRIRVPLLPRPGHHGCVRVPLLPRPGPRPGPHPVWLLKIYRGTRWEFGVAWHAGHCSNGHLPKGVLTIILAAACSMVLLLRLGPKQGLKK